MRKKRFYLNLAAAFTLPLVFILISSSVNSLSDEPNRGRLYRTFLIKWEGPALNASSADQSSLLTMVAESEVELDLAGATSTPTETPRMGYWVENDPQYPDGICKYLPCGPNDFLTTACTLP